MKWQETQKFLPRNQYLVKGIGTKSKKWQKKQKFLQKNEDSVQG